MADNVINIAKLVDLFDRAARASGFMDHMPSPMIGHFVRQIIPSSIQDGEIRLDQFYKWVRQEYSVPDHVFARVFSKVKEDVEEMGLKLVVPEAMSAGLDTAISGWLKSELKEMVYADLREEMRSEVRRELLGEMRPEVYGELRASFEKSAGLGRPLPTEGLPPLPDAEGLPGAEHLLTPVPAADEMADREELTRRLEAEVREDLRRSLAESVREELTRSLEMELRARIEEEARTKGQVDNGKYEGLPPDEISSFDEVMPAARAELAPEDRKRMEAEIREELRKSLWEEVRDEVKEDLRTVLKPVLEAELRSESGLAPAPAASGFEEIVSSGEGGRECYTAAGEVSGLFSERPPAPEPAPTITADDQLTIIKQIRTELTTVIRTQIMGELDVIARRRAEEEEKKKRLARLDDAPYCLERVREFLFPEQPALWDKVKHLINPPEWRAIVIAREEEDRLDPERLNRARSVLREAMKIKAEIVDERVFPDRVTQSPEGAVRIKSLSIMLDNADRLLDFALKNITDLIAEILPPALLEKTG